MEFLNTHVAVTGASGGIGRVLSEYLASQGLSVYGLDRKADPNPPDGVLAMAVDVTSAASVEAAVAAIYETATGPVDLVSCAGIVEGDVAAEDMTSTSSRRSWRSMCGESSWAVRLSDVSCWPGEVGAIVNVASMSGNCIVNYPQRQCAYNASKAAVTALTKSLAVEWGPRGVRVNAISPGYVDTPILADKPHQFAQWKEAIVLGRFADPVEIARAVSFLLSTDSSYCCGTELVIDGGYSLR